MVAKKNSSKASKKQNAQVPKEQEQSKKSLFVDVKIDRLVDKEGTNLKAIASANIGGAFAIHGIKITDSQKGLFISMPSTSYTDKHGNKKYNDVFHPITAEAREELIGKVKEAYEQALEEQEEVEEETQDAEIEEEPPGLTPVL